MSIQLNIKAAIAERKSLSVFVSRGSPLVDLDLAYLALVALVLADLAQTDLALVDLPLTNLFITGIAYRLPPIIE